jgi:hypothetical protein
MCNQCLSPLLLWVRSPLGRGLLDTTLCDKVYQWLATGRRFSQVTPVSSTNKTDRHDIAEILLKVVLNTIIQTKPSTKQSLICCILLGCDNLQQETNVVSQGIHIVSWIIYLAWSWLTKHNIIHIRWIQYACHILWQFVRPCHLPSSYASVFKELWWKCVFRFRLCQYYDHIALLYLETRKCRYQSIIFVCFLPICCCG